MLLRQLKNNPRDSLGRALGRSAGANKGTLTKSPEATTTPIRSSILSPRKLLPSTAEKMVAKCKKCGRGNNFGDWIACDVCDHWFHGQKCEDLSPSQYSHYKNKQINVPYLCKSCTINIKKSNYGASAASPTSAMTADDKLQLILDNQARFEKKMDEIKAEVCDIKNDVAALQQNTQLNSDELENVRTELGNIDSRLETLEKNDTNNDNQMTKRLKDLELEMKAENYQRHIRRKRIIISNIPTDVQNDKDFVIEFANAVGVAIEETDIRTTFRIKRKDPPHLPMLCIDFNHEDTKYKFLNNSKRQAECHPK